MYFGRCHSIKIRSLFNINAIGVDIITKKGTKIEVKESEGSKACITIWPKDLEASIFLVYYSEMNVFYLLMKRDLPVKRIKNSNHTSIQMRYIRENAYYSTIIDDEIVCRVNAS